MSDRALIPGQHVIRLARLMICADCAVAFDGSVWLGCPTCGTELGVMAHPLAAKSVEDKQRGDAQHVPSFSGTN